MADDDLQLRQILAKNINALLEAFPDLHAAEVARRAKNMDPKKITNYKHGRNMPNIVALQAIAQVYGVAYWQLLSPNFEVAHAKIEMDRLINAYAAASPENRDNILRVAEMAAAHGTGKKDP